MELFTERPEFLFFLSMLVGLVTVSDESRCSSEVSCTCEVDMREVSCRPVRSEDDTLTGAPR